MRNGTQLSIVNEIKLAIAAVALLIAVGTAGYVFIEGWGPLDAFYMTVITVFTVGFREVLPLSPIGQIFTTLLIMFGVGIALWAGTSMLQLALSPHARVLMRRRRMRKEIGRLKDHYVVCGYGRIGREVCACFMRRGVPHAIGDQDEAMLEELEGLGCPFVLGDCSDDETLKALGIGSAKGLVAAAGTDADNTFIVLSARALRPDLFIVARSTTPEAESKLKAAGADRVISPYEIGGRRIAAAVIQPTIVDFLDVAMTGDEVSLAMDEIVVSPTSPLAGQALVDSGIRQESGAVVLGIKGAGGQLNSNPAPSTVLNSGDILIALGTVQQLKALVKLAGV